MIVHLIHICEVLKRIVGNKSSLLALGLQPRRPTIKYYATPCLTGGAPGLQNLSPKRRH